MAEYLAFHTIDRALYSVLVTDLRRDPGESVEVMAFWILLERLGFINFVRYMLSLKPPTVDSYADEAAACLRFINNVNSDTNLPMTFTLLEGRISPDYFHQNRAAIASKLEEIVSRVCLKAFPDLVQVALEKQRIQDRGNRTMFVTFSRGHPVDEEEARLLFETLFGVGCIEAFHMDRHGMPAMYALVIFSGTEVVDRILNGGEKVKFAINGKHLWVRRHIPK